MVKNKEGFSDKANEDLSLVERAKNQDQKAYDLLMQRYRNSVYHLILKMVKNDDDAEDLTIEAFAKAFINIFRYNPDYAFSTWLFRIATNNCIDFIRKKRIVTTSIDSGVKTEHGEETMQFQIADGGLDPQQQFIRNQKIELMRMIVKNLPEKYQTLVKLRYFKEYSYDEIAKELDVPLGTVKAQLHRSRDILYKMIKNRKDQI